MPNSTRWQPNEISLTPDLTLQDPGLQARLEARQRAVRADAWQPRRGFLLDRKPVLAAVTRLREVKP